jgi:glyoxylase-like metal-dependent hydrolase (beta-lactamase superfamily II)
MSQSSASVPRFLVALVATVLLSACSGGTQRSQPRASTADTTSASSTTAPTRSEDVARFKIGDLAAVALRDGTLNFPNDNAVFGVGRTPGEVAALLEAAGAPGDSLHLSVQPLLVKAGDRVLLFDTGAGTNLGPTAGQLATALAAANVDPRSVTDIFISHAHGDHVGGLMDAQGALVFPNAAIHLSAPAWTFLKGMDAETARNVAIARYRDLVAAITPKVVAFAPGSEIIPGVVRAVDIRGHSPGHSGYLITSGQDSIFCIGDALHHYVVSVEKPEWPNGFDSDPKAAAASRRALLERAAASGQRLYGVHLPFPGIGKIEKRDGGFAWVPERATAAR